MQFITLLTDFGIQDGYPGVMKGVIYRILSNVHITDITHAIPPQDVAVGGLVLQQSYRYFPSGTVHVAVVDPGVGTQRRPMAAQIGEHYFVCPDNGLLTPVLEEAGQAGLALRFVHLDQPRYWLPEISSVFHGRDIFAPAAAHLAAGVPLDMLGSPINDPVRIDLPRPKPHEGGWRGQVVAVDHFGNLSTNIRREALAGHTRWQVRIAGHVIDGLSNTFGDGQPGDLVAIIDSSDQLSICIVNGSAAQRLKAGKGEGVEAQPFLAA